ncbi:MAG TPA: VOC family protein [Actinomycetota bacterium]|nr:VOC family protein [Actinomycetota bacterium]
MTVALEQVCIDAHDPERIARFWAEVLDYEIIYDSDKDPENDSPEREIELSSTNGSGTNLLFLQNNDQKNVKNRLHFDLRPDDQDAEVERVLALGARKVDIGQGQPSWVVLADPEGNEFCILSAKKPSED